MSNLDTLHSLGWEFTQIDDLFKTIVVKAPNGYMASLSMVERNPANVFYMLIQDMMQNDGRKKQE